MNELILVRTLIDEFTEQLIKFCKPLMVNPVLKKDVASLLNSESNLRMTIEFACEAQERNDMLNKLTLSLEEINMISDVLEKSEFLKSSEKTLIQEKNHSIKIMLENLIEI